MRTENYNLKICCTRHIIILFSNNQWELGCEEQKHQYFTGNGDECLSSIQECSSGTEHYTVMDMNYKLLGAVPYKHQPRR